MAEAGGQMEVDSDQNTNPNIGALKEAVKEAMEAVGNGSANGEAKVNGLQNGDNGEDSLDQVNGNSEDKHGDSEDANGDSEEANGDSVDANSDMEQNGDKDDVGESNEDNEDSQEGESSQDEDKQEEGMEVDGNESESNDKDTITITKSTKTSDKTESDVVELDDSIDEETKQQKEDDDEVKETMSKGEETDTVTITPKKKVVIEEVSIDDDAPSLRRSSRKKTPTKYHEIMERELQALSDQEDFEVEEVVDDGVEEIRDDDSDIQEVEAEDPLGNEDPFASSKSKSPNKDKPNVVTIDDLRTLQKLATSAKQSLDSQKKESLTIIDTNSILAGKMGSGVSITPARPRAESSISITPASLNLGSGVTIKPNNPGANLKGVSVMPVGRNSASPSPSVGSNKSSDEKGSGSGFGYNAKGELTDPNLTDDTYVVEAPSFIVPYVYEKPPLETFQQFKKSIEKMIEDNDREEKEKKEKERKEKDEERKKKKEEREKKQEEKEKRREERKKKRDEGEEVSDDSESEDEEEEDEEVIEPEEDKPKEKEEAKEAKKDDKDGNETEPKKAFFKSTLGKFFTDLGMNRVQEYVQADLLNQQKRKAQKDKSAAIMHAIMSLSKNLEDSRENNAHFKFDQKKCKFCSYRTESRTVMHHHMETPHMRNFIYRCNFCDYETKVPQEVLFHMEAEHHVKGKLERAPYFHQCPQCPFEDNGKGKLTRHKIGCDKRFKAETNLTPERDWDPPAKIRPPPVRPQIPQNMQQGRYPGQMNPQQQGGHYPNRPGQGIMPKQGQFQNNQRMPYRNMANMQGGRGRPVGSYKPSDLRIPQPQLSNMSRSQMQGGMRGLSPQMLASQQMLAALNQQGLSVSGSMSGNSRVGSNSNLSVPNLNSGSVTIQSLGQRGGIKNTSPSISITPLPGRNNPGQNNKGRQNSPAAGGAQNRNSPAMKPGQPGAGQGGGKGNFVICEICDGYIKDLEQLRNHMQWIHKVKIHPKMIYNRPPLNCQKCQFRFFTDQGLERHLLGSHGLVTASMQDAANKGQDSGRCPVCGKVYQWKLLNHVSKDHGKTLKPAHLSYKCTVCTATFGQYKLFENHVYTAHSGVAKKAEKAKQAAAAGKQQSMLKGQVKLSDEITIIPAKKTGDKPKPKSDEVINLDDEEEIDDVEDTEVIDLDNTPKKDKAEKGEASKADKTATKRKLEEDEEPEAKKSKDDDSKDVGDEESDK